MIKEPRPSCGEPHASQASLGALLEHITLPRFQNRSIYFKG